MNVSGRIHALPILTPTERAYGSNCRGDWMELRSYQEEVVILNLASHFTECIVFFLQ
jgi:hypothetical protein